MAYPLVISVETVKILFVPSVLVALLAYCSAWPQAYCVNCRHYQRVQHFLDRHNNCEYSERIRKTDDALNLVVYRGAQWEIENGSLTTLWRLWL